MQRLLSILLICLMTFSSLSSMAKVMGQEAMQQGMSHVYETNHANMNGQFSQQDCCDSSLLQDSSHHCSVACNICVAANYLPLASHHSKATQQKTLLLIGKPYHLNTPLERPPKFV